MPHLVLYMYIGYSVLLVFFLCSSSSSSLSSLSMVVVREKELADPSPDAALLLHLITVHQAVPRIQLSLLPSVAFVISLVTSRPIV
jgi:hypothetical protein